jgi:hypothetical protein
MDITARRLWSSLRRSSLPIAKVEAAIKPDYVYWRESDCGNVLLRRRLVKNAHRPPSSDSAQPLTPHRWHRTDLEKCLLGRHWRDED